MKGRGINAVTQTLGIVASAMELTFFSHNT